MRQAAEGRDRERRRLAGLIPEGEVRAFAGRVMRDADGISRNGRPEASPSNTRTRTLTPALNREGIPYPHSSLDPKPQFTPRWEDPNPNPNPNWILSLTLHRAGRISKTEMMVSLQLKEEHKEFLAWIIFGHPPRFDTYDTDGR